MEGEMAEIARRFLQDLFFPSGTSDTEHILPEVDRCIWNELNAMLTTNYTMEEIYAALKEIGPTKAPRIDEFPDLFFQKYWHIVGGDKTSFCLRVLNKGKEFDQLIPQILYSSQKCQTKKNMVNFIPISICSVIYKILAKVAANPFQKLLEVCTDKAQSAFKAFYF